MGCANHLGQPGVNGNCANLARQFGLLPPALPRCCQNDACCKRQGFPFNKMKQCVQHLGNPQVNAMCVGVAQQHRLVLGPKACYSYLTTTGCGWTSDYNCPGQPLGRRGAAGQDGTLGYKCCCAQSLWRMTTMR